MNTPFAPLRHPYPEPPEIGAAIQIANGILWIRMPLPMVLDHVNIYALDEGDSWTLIDTGFDSKKSREIWQTVLAGPLGGKPVGRVIVTHHHPDHIGLAGWFQTSHGAQLWTTRTAWLMARMLVLDEQAVAAPETIEFWRQSGMEAGLLQKRSTGRPFNFADVVAPMPLGYRRIVEGEQITMGGRNWAVRMGNGHAPEHATFWSSDGDIVIGGDQLLSTISPNIGVYATEPDADPLAEWLEACERLKQFATEDQLVLPGHKLPFTGLPVRMRQLIENHHGALRRLKVHLKQPRTAAQCFSVLFKRSIGEGEYGLALVEAVAHLNHLFQLGEIGRVKRDDGAWYWQAKG
ncbi:MAG: MBL fold metallo-hydrolase [Paracoccaceae bacterium]